MVLLTLTDKNAKAAPDIPAIEAMRKPKKSFTLVESAPALGERKYRIRKSAKRDTKAVMVKTWNASPTSARFTPSWLLPEDAVEMAPPEACTAKEKMSQGRKIQ